MAKKKTVFQALDSAISGNWDTPEGGHVNTYDLSKSGNEVLFRTKNKDEYLQQKLELQQDKYIKDRWVKANVNLSVTAYAGLNNIKLMYRDADLMDAFPEIGAALDIVSEESCLASNDDGQIVHVYSKSDRIRSILEDLFVNRLNIQLTGQMVVRAMCKYGNQFMLLDIDHKDGVRGWRQLPVFNVERLENGIQNPFGAGLSLAVNNTDTDDIDTSTKFIWLDANNSQVPFRDWQIAHFRLLSNSLYLPYGVSYLNAARRHWRMLSLMEDMMLIYRLERSVERRVYKIFVGNIDDADVEAYVEKIANEFKRTPIIDPITGQVDLRKNILPVHKDTPIPLLDGRTITIEELAKEFEDGKENYVYSIQDKTKQIVPGKVVWCGKNYTADELVKITLDDGSHMIMAKEHEIIMRDGTKKRADEVSVGESVMPLYRKVDKNSAHLFDRYEKVYNPNSGKYEHTHRLVAREVSKDCAEYNTVHHKDFNKYNNNPTNLMWMDYFEHHKAHGELAKKNWNDPEKRELHIKHLSEACKGSSIKTNHKITKIEIVGGDDVYCMTVVGLNGEDDRHNFALTTWKADGSLNESGVFVSNCYDQDIFIPVREENAATPIDTLAAGNNLTALDDIKFVQNKVFTALRIPKAFINFEEATGEGKNLSLMDIRFTRTVNRIQQAFLMELTKVATIHLFLLGFEDELTNFTLSMNNPSTQAEQLEIENLEKKINAVRDAVSDPGNGIPVMSLVGALKRIMGWSEREIKENFEEMRLEKALAAELEKTTQIIKRTGIFDKVDRIYGEPGAEYADDQQGGEDGGMGDMGGGGGGFGGDFGGDMGGMDDMGADMGDQEGDLGGMEGSMPTADMGGGGAGAPPEGGAPPPMESVSRNKPLLLEDMLSDILKENDKKSRRNREVRYERAESNEDSSLFVNEEFDRMIDALGKFVKDDE